MYVAGLGGAGAWYEARQGQGKEGSQQAKQKTHEHKPYTHDALRCNTTHAPPGEASGISGCGSSLLAGLK